MDTNLYKYNNVPSGLPVVPKKSNTKKYVLVLLVLIVAGVAVFAFIKKDWLISLAKKEEPTVNLPPAPKYTKTDLPTDKLPEIFPKDLIQEKDPVILENFEAKLFDGLQTQYTLKFITKKSAIENFQAYRRYFNENQWAILNQDQKDNFATIRVAKNYDSIIITHTINQTNGIQIIDLTLTRSNTKKSASTTSQNVN